MRKNKGNKSKRKSFYITETCINIGKKYNTGVVWGGGMYVAL
jgi:hypothetical protein